MKPWKCMATDSARTCGVRDDRLLACEELAPKGDEPIAGVEHAPKKIVRCDGSCAICDSCQCALPMGHRDPSICYCVVCLTGGR